MAALACSSFLAISKAASAPPACSQTSPSSSSSSSAAAAAASSSSSSSASSASSSPSLGLRASRSALFGGASLRMLRKEPQQRSNGRAAAAAASVRAAVDTAKLEKLGGEIKSLTLEEARSLVDWLQAELGVTAAAFAPAAAVPGAPGAAPGAEAAAAPAAEEQTEFDVIIDEVPTAQRIAVIKAIRSVTTLGLKEAKDLIEGLPKPLKSAVPKEEAEEAKKQLEAAGAKCSLK